MLGWFRNIRGSITVFSTLVLIPVVFFMGFFADFVRIKSYTNMAIMAADSYGESYIAQYDNVLKEAYGLFAITQEPDGLKEAEFYKDAIKWDFDPSGEKVSGMKKGFEKGYEWFSGTDKYPKGTLMPMKSVKVNLECKPIEKANLKDTNILGTQINDFMKYRIAQVLMNEKDSLLETLDSVKKLESDTKIVNKKIAYDETVQEVMEAVRKYYEKAKEFEGYCNEVENLRTEYKNIREEIIDIVETEIEIERQIEAEREAEAEDEDEDGDGDEDEDYSLSEDDKKILRENNCRIEIEHLKSEYEICKNEFSDKMNSYTSFCSDMRVLYEKVSDAFKT